MDNTAQDPLIVSLEWGNPLETELSVNTGLMLAALLPSPRSWLLWGSSAHPIHLPVCSPELKDLPDVRPTAGRTHFFSHPEKRCKFQLQMISQNQKARREEKAFNAHAARAEKPFHRGAVNSLHLHEGWVKFTMPCRLIHGKSFQVAFTFWRKSELSSACSPKHLVGKGEMEAEPKIIL